MTSNNTIWNKKFNHNNITEGLDVKKEEDKRSKKDKEQHKVLDDIKRKLETMANKRKGFTKLPHLEGLNNTNEPSSDTTSDDNDSNNNESNNGNAETFNDSYYIDKKTLGLPDWCGVIG